MSLRIWRKVDPQLLAILLDDVETGTQKHRLEIRVIEIQEGGEGVH